MPQFKIIDSKNYFKTKGFRIAALSIFLAIFIFTGTRGGKYGNGLLRRMGLFEDVGIWFVLFQIVIGVLLVVTYFYSRKTRVLGTISMDDENVVITSNHKTIHFILKDVKKFKIVHNSYVGEDIKDNPLNNFTGDNWIIIDYKNKSLKLEFLVDSLFKTTQLSNIIDSYSKEYSNFEYEIK
ncbi:hypothetical protein GYB57_04260 [bacterium]|nr:hypothetical protein [bacterium]